MFKQMANRLKGNREEKNDEQSAAVLAASDTSCDNSASGANDVNGEGAEGVVGRSVSAAGGEGVEGAAARSTGGEGAARAAGASAARGSKQRGRRTALKASFIAVAAASLLALAAYATPVVASLMATDGEGGNTTTEETTRADVSGLSVTATPGDSTVPGVTFKTVWADNNNVSRPKIEDMLSRHEYAVQFSVEGIKETVVVNAETGETKDVTSFPLTTIDEDGKLVPSEAAERYLGIKSLDDILGGNSDLVTVASDSVGTYTASISAALPSSVSLKIGDGEAAPPSGHLLHSARVSREHRQEGEGRNDERVSHHGNGRPAHGAVRLCHR